MYQWVDGSTNNKLWKFDTPTTLQSLCNNPLFVSTIYIVDNYMYDFSVTMENKQISNLNLSPTATKGRFESVNIVLSYRWRHLSTLSGAVKGPQRHMTSSVVLVYVYISCHWVRYELDHGKRNSCELWSALAQSRRIRSMPNFFLRVELPIGTKPTRFFYVVYTL